MKTASLVLSVMALLGCGLLWNQNQNLSSELSKLEASIEELKSEKPSESTKPTTSTPVKREVKRSETRSRTDFGGIKGEKESKADPEKMDEKFQEGNERIIVAIKAFGEEKQIGSETIEDVIDLVVGNLSEQHEIRKSIATGETNREDGRSEVLELREAQNAGLSEMLGSEVADELISAIRSARMPPARGR
jgi:hypothetical protein